MSKIREVEKLLWIFIFGKLWATDLLLIHLRKQLLHTMILKIKLLRVGNVENTPQDVIKTMR